ncbi:3-alpha-hydroxysteroid dehydrogenase [Sphingomonas sp. DBB INV C78]
MVDGRVAIVTGAASGMGKAIAARLDREGAIVIATDRTIDGIASPIGTGSHGLFEKLDVTNQDDWSRVAELANARFGPPSILVNNAGILHFSALLETTTEQLRAIIDVNLIGAFIGIRTIAPFMAAKGSGSIVNICSIDATKATNGASAYVASKWGLRGLTKAAALELGPLGIRVNAIHPGGISTPMVRDAAMTDEAFDAIYHDIPLQRAGLPEEVAEAVLYLASDRSSYCAGTEILVDGGATAGKYYAQLPGAPPFASP